MKDSQWIPELRRRCQADVQMRVYQQEVTHLRNHLLSTMTPWQQKILQDYESCLTDFARLLAKNPMKSAWNSTTMIYKKGRHKAGP